MSTTRRNALRTILQVLVTGSALAMSGPALAALSPEDCKYVTMVRLQQNAIDQHSELKAKQADNVAGRMVPTIDTLLRYAMDNFDGGTTAPAAIAETSKLFNTRDYWDTLDVAQLKEILDVVVPVAVARNLLARHKMTFLPKNMASWDRFSDKYQSLILAA